MNTEQFIKRLGVIEKTMILINQSSPRAKHLDTLKKAGELIKTYPLFTNELPLKRVDRFVSLAITKIHFGLMGDLPPKPAIEKAFGYLSEALKETEEIKGRALLSSTL